MGNGRVYEWHPYIPIDGRVGNGRACRTAPLHPHGRACGQRRACRTAPLHHQESFGEGGHSTSRDCKTMMHIRATVWSISTFRHSGIPACFVFPIVLVYCSPKVTERMVVEGAKVNWSCISCGTGECFWMRVNSSYGKLYKVRDGIASERAPKFLSRYACLHLLHNEDKVLFASLDISAFLSSFSLYLFSSNLKISSLHSNSPLISHAVSTAPLIIILLSLLPLLFQKKKEGYRCKN